jgi:hypothetical protein
MHWRASSPPGGRALVDRELYLSGSWTGDRDHGRETGVPDDVQFATKPELARLMLGRALDAGMPAAWVTADEAYGWDGKFRYLPRPLPGPPLRPVVPARHPRHAGARLPRRHRGDRPKSPGSGLIPVTLGEVRRLPAHLTATIPSRAAAWVWSNWRRRHQHQAKTSHHQRRESRCAGLPNFAARRAADHRVLAGGAGEPRYRGDCGQY